MYRIDKHFIVTYTHRADFESALNELWTRALKIAHTFFKVGGWIDSTFQTTTTLTRVHHCDWLRVKKSKHFYADENVNGNAT